MDASCQDEVTVGSQDGNGDGGMLQRVGMVERQGGWLAGVVYGKDVLAVAQAVVNTDDIDILNTNYQELTTNYSKINS